MTLKHVRVCHHRTTWQEDFLAADHPAPGSNCEGKAKEFLLDERAQVKPAGHHVCASF